VNGDSSFTWSGTNNVSPCPAGGASQPTDCAAGLGLALGMNTPDSDERVPGRAELRERLTPEQYSVMFEHGTERPGSSPLLNEHRSGVFECAACGAELFASDTKFESGTGWPSFFASLPDSVGLKTDLSHGMNRTEYHCARCGAHQGHLFPDGPEPTGLRFCNNGLSLHFRPASD